MINAKTIQQLMLEVVRTFLRNNSCTESPMVIAMLVYQAKYLGGMLEHAAALPDPKNPAPLACRSARRAAGTSITIVTITAASNSDAAVIATVDDTGCGNPRLGSAVGNPHQI